MTKPSILIVGCGAVGSLYGGMLQQAGARVSVVLRSDRELARSRGIAVRSCWGDFILKPDAVYADCNEIDTPPDYILVALKVLPEIDRVALIRNVVGPETTIILLQNGIEIEADIARAFPENEIISGLAFVCCGKTGPAEFRHLDYGQLKLGNYPGGLSDKARSLGEMFQSVDVPVDLSEDVVLARWWKLVWNAPFNPISVLAGGATTAEMLANPPTFDLIRKVMTDVATLAASSGKALPDDIVETMLEMTRSMKPYKTSMLLDAEARRPLEVEAILGNAVRIARDMNTAVPHIETLYGLLSLFDQQNRGL